MCDSGRDKLVLEFQKRWEELLPAERAKGPNRVWCVYQTLLFHQDIMGLSQFLACITVAKLKPATFLEEAKQLQMQFSGLFPEAQIPSRC